MATYGYARISSREQNPERQLIALGERGIGRSEIYLDRMSGKNFERPEYRRMLRRLGKGDLVIIKSIDRLGRDYGEILNQWRVITKEKGANIEVLDMPLLNTAAEQNGLTGVFISDLVLQILAYVAETEREFIHQRQSEGIAVARARGVKFGRGKADETEHFDEAYGKLLSGELSTRDAARLAGMSHSTFYRRCRERRETEQNKDCFNK